MKAMIQGRASTMTVGSLPVGTLFRVANDLSERLFVKAGDGLSTASYKDGRAGGKKIVGANSKQPPFYAVIVPTANRFDRRAYTPASNKINANTPVVSTHGTLVIDLNA